MHRKRYSVTAEKALEHANAHMINFISTNTPGLENWTEAYIDPKPLELYDPSGRKLYYQFSVYKNSNLIGRIYIGADKKMGHSVQLVELDSKPFDAAKAIKKNQLKSPKMNTQMGKLSQLSWLYMIILL